MEQETIRKRCTGFTQISNEIILSPSISSKAKALYCYLFSRQDGWVFYRSEVQKHFKEGRDAMSGAFKELEDCGLISKSQKRDGNRLSGVIISLGTKFSDDWKSDDSKSDDSKSAPINTNTTNTDYKKEIEDSVPLSYWGKTFKEFKDNCPPEFRRTVEGMIASDDRRLSAFKNFYEQNQMKGAKFYKWKWKDILIKNINNQIERGMV